MVRFSSGHGPHLAGKRTIGLEKKERRGFPNFLAEDPIAYHGMLQYTAVSGRF
jgi:hypothetical protein